MYDLAQKAGTLDIYNHTFLFLASIHITLGLSTTFCFNLYFLRILAVLQLFQAGPALSRDVKNRL